MNKSLSEVFCLKEGRKNFQINVRSSAEDRSVYFGQNRLNEELTQDIRDRYAMGFPPKKFIYGLYGAGKTHTLYNMVYQLVESPSASDFGYVVKCPIIEGEFRKKTGFDYLHGQIMEAIGLENIKSLVQRFLQNNATQNLSELLLSRFRYSNISKAIHNLGLGAQDVTIWKWLTGGKLGTGELTTLGLTKNIDTTEEMTTIIAEVGKMFNAEDTYYLFMLDELEGLKNVTDDDAQRSFHDAFRKLASDENDSVGFIVSIYAGQEDDIPDFIWESDITNRIGRDNIHDIRYLHEEGAVELFLSDLFQLTIDPDLKTQGESEGTIPPGLNWYPFIDAAKDQFVNDAISAVTASLPRNIIRAVNECALQALRRDSRVIEPQDLTPVSMIFREDF